MKILVLVLALGSSLLAVRGADVGDERVGFDVLGGFKYQPPPDGGGAAAEKRARESREGIPSSIQEWDGKRARVTGYMLPVKLEDGTGLVTDFLLVRDPMMCCYGVVPAPNDWVVVHMAKPVPALQDVPLSFVGTLHVGPIFENGYLTGIYRLDGEKRTD